MLRVVLLAAITLVAAAVAAGARTTVTEYSYNDDGALTSVSRQVDDRAPEVTYLTWDNFVPDVADPTTGTVRLGTGTLSAIGPAPGRENASEQFSFDPRDRLLDHSGVEGEQTYDYHARGMMASASRDDDQLRFYYDTEQDARLSNIHQASTDTWSAYLGKARFLNDGSEEVLLNPRKKDIEGSYRPVDESLESYSYEAYGSSASTPPADGGYDLASNPMRYAGEYRDPIWGGYYLRARWYHPEYAVFLSRDSMSNLGRYNYTSGNPIMRVDPSGLKFDYMNDVGKPLGGFLKGLNKGFFGHIARFFLSPLLGPLQIIADPGGFWNAIKTNQNGIDVFLVLGIASEAIGGYVDAAYAAVGTSFTKRFLTRTISDVALGLGQSTAAAARRGFDHFDWNTFVQGAELTAGAVFYRRVFRFNVRKAKNGVVGPVGNVGNNAGNLANNITHTPLESSQGVLREDSYEAPWMQRHDDGLLSNVDDAEFERQVIESQVKNRQREFLNNRNETLSEIRSNAKTQLKGGHGRSFVKGVKGSATRVSRAPSFDDILEESGTSNSFPNQAANHSHGIVDELVK